MNVTTNHTVTYQNLHIPNWELFFCDIFYLFRERRNSYSSSDHWLLLYSCNAFPPDLCLAPSLPPGPWSNVTSFKRPFWPFENSHYPFTCFLISFPCCFLILYPLFMLFLAYCFPHWDLRSTRAEDLSHWLTTIPLVARTWNKCSITTCKLNGRDLAIQRIHWVF